MPRPKRTKVAPSAPQPRLKKVAKSTARAVPEAPKAPFDDLYDVSDPEEGVVTNARRVKKNNGKEKATLAPNRAQTEAVEAEPILDDIDLGSSSPAVEVGRRESTQSILAIGNFRRRARQPSILGRGAGRARSSSVESNLAYDNGLTSVRRKNASVMGNVRRQPREGSVMGRNVVPSSMGLEMDRGTTPNVGSAIKIGNFKRREREASILRTGQEAQRPPLDYEDEEDDFNPDDESTPLNQSKTRHTTSSSALSHLDVRARSRASTALPRPAPRRKVTKPKAPVKPAPKPNAKRTYGRANQTSDKENEEVDPDDSLAPLPDDGNDSPENSLELEKRVGKELKQAARKFAEVDKWELEFEDVTASSSSPKDAR
ncbi:uncharacterized protein LY89DRAFT_581568 [Mollisia scopiformis]|uniref:Uncharacterized protein n=1 Tax=Mollisia scopiformis TaxID=149040 RepID=A0A194XHD5_MOLSC|nr:uncharacterized protein LY89DRAFT_581568 [Mollisia scopiformis]KUJ19182.1 hypothetical protein LY89DRAFT_581568 [Mollisia scopiformis]